MNIICPELLLTIAVLSLLPSCAGTSGHRTTPPEGAQIQQLQIRQVEVIELPVDFARQRKTQLAFDEGHQPWRTEAKSVACAEIAHLLSEGKVKPELQLPACVDEAKTEEEATKALVTVQRNNLQYRVYLERLVKTDGIWTARKIEVAGAASQ